MYELNLSLRHFIFYVLGTLCVTTAYAKSCQELFKVQASQVNTSLQQPNLEDLRQNIMAVHMKNYFPRDGIIRAGDSKAMGLRTNIHFSLGEMVVSHDGGSWENKNFGILVPFEHLEPQLLNIFQQDTYVLGDFKLSKGAIIVHSDLVQLPEILPGVEYISFNPEKISMSDKIQQVLKEKNKWQFQADGPYEFSQLKINGNKVDPKKVFKSLLDRYPHLTTGLHDKHSSGYVDKFMLENLGLFHNSSLSVNRASWEWRLRLEVIKSKLSGIKNNALETKKPQIALNALNRNLKKIQRQLNILEAEIQLQNKTGKTLLGTSGLKKEFLNEVLLKSENLSELLEFFSDNSYLLNSAQKNESVKSIIRSYEFNELRSDLSIEQFTQFLKTYFPDEANYGGLQFQLFLQKFDKNLMKNEPFDNEISNDFLTQLRGCRASHCEEIIFRLLNPKMKTLRNDVLNHPDVIRKFKSKYYLPTFIEYTSYKIYDLMWAAEDLVRQPNPEMVIQKKQSFYLLEKIVTEKK